MKAVEMPPKGEPLFKITGIKQDGKLFWLQINDGGWMPIDKNFARWWLDNVEMVAVDADE